MTVSDRSAIEQSTDSSRDDTHVVFSIVEPRRLAPKAHRMNRAHSRSALLKVHMEKSISNKREPTQTVFEGPALAIFN